MPTSPPIGVALAGGRSRRMGQDKTRLQLPDGLDLLSWTAERLSAACEHTIIAGGERRLGECVLVADGPGQGPVAGILGAAEQYPDRSLLVLACDLPLVSVDLLRYMAASPGDWAVPRHRVRTHGRSSSPDLTAELNVEPLCALYSPKAIGVLHTRVATGHFDLHGLVKNREISIAYLEDEALERFGDTAMLFSNLNRPQDVEKFAALRHNVYVQLRSMTTKN